MSFGLLVKNSRGNLQIDENYINLQLKQKLTVTLKDNTPPNWGGGSNVWRTSRYTLDASNHPNCIIAVGFTNQANITIPLSVLRIGNNWHIDAYSKVAGLQVDVFIFAFDGGYYTTGKYGLRVFNSEGKETFNSNKRYLKVLTAINGDYSSHIQQDKIVEKSFTSIKTAEWQGRKLAYCFMNTPFYDERTFWEDADDETLWGTDITQTGTFVRVSGNDLFLEYKRIVVYTYKGIPPDEYDRSAHSLSFLLVDVTNY